LKPQPHVHVTHEKEKLTAISRTLFNQIEQEINRK